MNRAPPAFESADMASSLSYQTVAVETVRSATHAGVSRYGGACLARLASAAQARAISQ